MSERRIALAIQKPTGKTNMGDETLQILEAGGLKFKLPSRVDDGPTNISGLDIWTMRNADITQAISIGVASLGIVGLDKYTEFTNGTADRPKPLILSELGYSYCTLKLGVRQDIGYTTPEDLKDKIVATSYPKGTERFFEEAGVSVRILKCEGGAETYVRRGVAQACVEVSETGNSMKLNGINPVADVMRSQAILIANPRLDQDTETQGPIWRAVRTVQTGLDAKFAKMIKLNFPADRKEDILKALPSRKSPTLFQSGDNAWLAAESLVPARDYDKIKQELLLLGAEDIFQLPIADPSPNLDDPRVNRMMRVMYGEKWQLPTPPYSIL